MYNSQNEENEIVQEPISFSTANMPVQVAARALQMDCQTVRILCQQGLVNWGKAFKRPGSRSYTYIISPKAFYEETGFLWKERLANDSE